MSGGSGCAPRAPQWRQQSPELEPSACPGLGSLAGAAGGFQAGIWMPPVEFVLPSRAGARLGLWLCFASWTQCWGSGQTPNPARLTSYKAGVPGAPRMLL